MKHYLPETLMTVHGRQPVVGSAAFPPFKHPARCPIKAEFTVVRAVLEDGSFRWFGCDAAYIDSSLRMVLVNARQGELLKTWEEVPPEAEDEGPRGDDGERMAHQRACEAALGPEDMTARRRKARAATNRAAVLAARRSV